MEKEVVKSIDKNLEENKALKEENALLKKQLGEAMNMANRYFLMAERALRLTDQPMQPPQKN